MRQTLLRDLFSALESGAPACGADAIDEYRELSMLAHAWERSSLKPAAAEEVLGRVEGIEGKGSVRR